MSINKRSFCEISIEHNDVQSSQKNDTVVINMPNISNSSIHTIELNDTDDEKSQNNKRSSYSLNIVTYSPAVMSISSAKQSLSHPTSVSRKIANVSQRPDLQHDLGCLSPCLSAKRVLSPIVHKKLQIDNSKLPNVPYKVSSMSSSSSSLSSSKALSTNKSVLDRTSVSPKRMRYVEKSQIELTLYGNNMSLCSQSVSYDQVTTFFSLDNGRLSFFPDFNKCHNSNDSTSFGSSNDIPCFGLARADDDAVHEHEIIESIDLRKNKSSTVLMCSNSRDSYNDKCSLSQQFSSPYNGKRVFAPSTPQCSLNDDAADELTLADREMLLCQVTPKANCDSRGDSCVILNSASSLQSSRKVLSMNNMNRIINGSPLVPRSINTKFSRLLDTSSQKSVSPIRSLLCQEKKVLVLDTVQHIENPLYADLDDDLALNCLDAVSVTSHYYAYFNRVVFDGKLTSNILIVWSSRMSRSSGQTKLRVENGERVVKISLSKKLLTTVIKLKKTLLHEMCHVAQVYIDRQLSTSHGPLFEKWLAIANSALPDIGVAKFHSYDSSTTSGSLESIGL